MGDEEWQELGVRDETVAAWKELGVDAFTAALAQGDGYGPSSARHYLGRLKEVVATWRSVDFATSDGLRWHRAGFGAREAGLWRDRGVGLDEAALEAGHRMVG